MHFFILGCFLSFNVFSSANPPTLMISESENLNNRWSFMAALGYSGYQQINSSNNQNPLARLALSAELIATDQANFGVEFGVQTGNRMHLVIPQSNFTDLQNPVRSTIRPMIDLLLTAHANPVDESLLFTQIKGGIAYRYWQIDSVFFHNKSAMAAEIQAGFGYPLTEISNLNLLYQGIFGGNPRLYLHPSYLGYVANLPIQHGFLLGLSVIV
ncbi:MAG: hypothetical protein H0U57_04540 [Tatlockia sp.]|nr:hypothetical protein [Tatlockia sp.]